jgi:hypothetical protein
MKNSTILIMLILLFTSFSSIAQEPENCICCTEKYTQFDYWVGNWEVYDLNEKLIGTNKITKEYDNCLLRESWKSQGKLRGTSTNFYDKSDDSWNQVWVDNTGFVLRLKGGLIQGNMVLKSELTEGNNGKFYHQISWIKNENGTITQLWETFNKEHVKLSEAFRGIYKKRLN